MSDRPPRNDAAMSEILSSIRRIVAEEDRRPAAHAARAAADEDILLLTPAMRVAADATPPAAAATPAPVEEAFELSADEAMVADIARAVLRDELLEGEVGRAFAARLRAIAREEVARALAETGRARE